MRSNILGVCSAVVSVAVAGSAVAIPTGVATNGGASWNGWTSYGDSNTLGIYGSGSNGSVYRIYQTVFTFDNNTMNLGSGYTGDSFSGGPGFAHGNLIYGLGIERVSGTGTMGTVTVGFDLSNDSYQAASSVGGTDGRVSTSVWSQNRDFNVQMFAGGSGQIGVQLGNGTGYSGSSNFAYSGNSGGLTFAFRGATNGVNRQMFFDITAMNAQYTQAGAFGSWTTGINSIGQYFRMSLDTGGMGSRTFVQSIQVPAPGAAALIGLAGFVGGRRRKA